MQINHEFDKRAAVHSSKTPWQHSPMPGVDRRMLDRLGDEVARATTIVRYAPQSSFSPHIHTGGEEFYVLDGVFQDEHGDFPAGSYIRNPPQSSHTPRSEKGCTIFVKLWQFDLADRKQVRIDTNTSEFKPDAENKHVETILLHQDENETVSIEHLAANQEIDLKAVQSAEILILDGNFSEQGECFEPNDWLRLPVNSKSIAKTGPKGAKIWIKRGHLRQMPSPPPSQIANS